VKPLIVIPTLNEEAHIETCVRSLVEGDEIARASRILVVDGGSSDATRAIVERLRAEFPNLSLEDNPRRIQAAAVNRAAQLAAGDEDVLVRCDAHSIYPDRFVTRLLDALERTGADSVVTPMDAQGEGCFQRAVAWVVDTKLGSGGAPHRGGVRSGFVDHGHHAAFRLAMYRQAGGYDESFTHNEDAELDRRIHLAGGRIWLDADIRIGYVPRSTAAGLWRQYRAYGSGRAAMLAKHKLTPAPRQAIPILNLALLAASVAILPIAPLIGLLWPAAYLALLIGTSLGVSLWKRSACGLLAGPALAIIHVAWPFGFVSSLMARGGRPAGAPHPAAAAPKQ
jgi:succinoglycan biosynthesis protein ExoA